MTALFRCTMSRRLVTKTALSGSYSRSSRAANAFVLYLESYCYLSLLVLMILIYLTSLFRKILSTYLIINKLTKNAIGVVLYACNVGPLLLAAFERQGLLDIIIFVHGWTGDQGKKSLVSNFLPVAYEIPEIRIPGRLSS